MNNTKEENVNGKIILILVLFVALVNVVFYIGDSMKKDSSKITTRTNCFPLK